MNDSSGSPPPATVVPRAVLVPFILVTSLFALWGFANDITNPMVAAFKNILLISHFESSLVQAAFYGGYCVMAFPAALFIQRCGYQKGLAAGLLLYALGCFLFIPSGWLMDFHAFLAAYFIMTCGLSFLETSANPYIMALGPEETATRRLNFAQAFNPLGSITGMLVASHVVLANLNPATEDERGALRSSDPAAFDAIRAADLDVIVGPYAVLGLVVFALFVVFLVKRLPEGRGGADHDLHVGRTLGRLARTPHYLWGVVAQAFYVGAQIMVWTFIIQYAGNELGMDKKTAQQHNIAAMAIFVSSRFICTWLMRFVAPGLLLALLACGGLLLTLGTILMTGMPGLWCLIGVSACMSLMFPTIYGIALQGLGGDTKLGAAGLIFAIGGGCLMPPMQGAIMDLPAFDFGAFTLSSTRVSFALPALCFVVIALYGAWMAKRRVTA
ncbi:MAG: L-fucose:H+ symporter permease [Verrucomicrobia bacterium]|nr:L-fucose:H+ symporter permease [Verrucomicrobiota bacterium]